MFQLFKRFKRSEKGQGMVEIGLILALVSIVVIGALGGIGGKVNDTFDRVVGAVSGGEIIPEDEALYTDEQIQDLVDNQGYIKVETADDLNNVRNKMDGKYIQVANIDLDDVDSFEPIGRTNDANSFKGTFDGGGYVISNLTISRGATDYVGLFGRANGATLKNIGLVDVNVKGRDQTGGLVGLQSGSTVTNSYATGNVNGRSHTGGLVGYQQINSSVSDSYATGLVTGGNNVGGLVGYQDVSSVSDSYATGTVTGTGSHTGGLVGYQQTSSTVSNSYATGSVTGGGDTGGLVGLQHSSSEVINCYATGNVNGGNNTGGLVGLQQSSSTTNSYYDINTTGQSDAGKGTGKSTDEMKNKDTYTGWNFESIWTIESGQYPTHR